MAAQPATSTHVHRLGQRQLKRSRTVHAAAPTVWSLLADSALLPSWAPAVERVEQWEAQGESVGAVRRCAVNLAGKPGVMVERCVEMSPERSITYRVEEESFGMRALFDGYGFRVSLKRAGEHATEVTIETFYTPRNLPVWALNAVAMRRRLRGVVDGLLDGLASAAETTVV